MGLAARNQSAFSVRDRIQGRESFEEGHVHLLHDDAVQSVAKVGESRGKYYTVTFDWGDDVQEGFEADCSCPRFGNGYQCKHVWAAMLALDAANDRETRPSSFAFPKDATISTPRVWARTLAKLQQQLSRVKTDDRPPVTVDLVTARPAQCWFAISLSHSVHNDTMRMVIYWSERLGPDEWSSPSLRSLTDCRAELVDTRDRRILGRLTGMAGIGDLGGMFTRLLNSLEPSDPSFDLPDLMVDELLEDMAATGRLVWTLDPQEHLVDDHAVAWENGPFWRLVLSVARRADKCDDSELTVTALLKRDEELVELTQIVMAFTDGLILFHDRLSRMSKSDALWITGLMKGGPIHVPRAECDQFLGSLLTMPFVPELQLDTSLGVTETQGHPTGRLELTRVRYSTSAQLQAEIVFKYEGELVKLEDPRDKLWIDASRQVMSRNREVERALLSALTDYGFRAHHSFAFQSEIGLSIGFSQLPRIVTDLVNRGWEVVVDQKVLRRHGQCHVQVKSDQDWFDVDAEIDFDGVPASLPQLLAAIRDRDRFITLDDGSQGMLPEEWLDRFQKIASIGDESGGKLRFHRTRALLADALLAEQPDVSLQYDFVELCRKMRAFVGIQPVPAPRGFTGTLRAYQAEGLAWFGFLREFHFGGCLADDMGLGKTVQVLALLESRRSRRVGKNETRRPSLVVAPKSLVFNWLAEAQRFAPKLRFLNYTGVQRVLLIDELDKIDVILTTYGTLRGDIDLLKEVHFDYAILDEAQAIKNAASQTAKASRFIRAEYRLAMTGTPVENHLGELWSLLDFLNPGMVGSSVRSGLMSRTPDQDNEMLDLLRHSLRPFILRRTKEQVLQELPEKFEETIYCEMTAKQQKLYDELRDYYRAQLTMKIKELGIRKSKIHVLEALLRLRQAACDPRLLDKKQATGAKLQTLCERLEQVLDEGHKVLVFSQFTSLLALLRRELDERRWTYEYLDGKTQRRADKVNRFQEDDACRLFLISLKAGGQGLNLTAADYVFILDPWWNPAVEAQAIDRAHRIGQNRQVMAYRIICRDTVEEKIIALQESKRELADAIITANESLIRQMTADDLQLLLT